MSFPTLSQQPPQQQHHDTNANHYQTQPQQYHYHQQEQQQGHYAAPPGDAPVHSNNTFDPSLAHQPYLSNDKPKITVRWSGNRPAAFGSTALTPPTVAPPRTSPSYPQAAPQHLQNQYALLAPDLQTFLYPSPESGSQQHQPIVPYAPDQESEMARRAKGGASNPPEVRSTASQQQYQYNPQLEQQNYSGRPTRSRADAVNYNEASYYDNTVVSSAPQRSQYQQQAAAYQAFPHQQHQQQQQYQYQQQQQQQHYSLPPQQTHTIPSTSSDPIGLPAGNASNGGGGGNDEDEEEYQEDADGSDDDYGAPPSKKTGSNKRGAKARGGGKARGGRGGRASGRATRKKYDEDDEEDYEEEQEDEEEEEEDDDIVNVAASKQNSGGRTRRAAASAQINYAQQQAYPVDEGEDEAEEEEDAGGDGYEEKDTTIQPHYTDQPQFIAPSALQIVPNSQPNASGPTVAQSLFPESESNEVLMSANTASTSKRHNRVVNSDEDADGEEAPTSDALSVLATNAPSARDALPTIKIPPPAAVQVYETSSGRRTTRKAIVESSDEDDDRSPAKTRSQSKQARKYAGEDIVSEGSYNDDDEEYGENKRRYPKRKVLRNGARQTRAGTARASRRRGEDDDDDYEENSRTRYSPSPSEEELDLTDTESVDELGLQAMTRNGRGRNYRLRKRAEVNYSLPAMFGLNPDGTPAANAAGTNAAGEGEKKPKKKKSGYGAPQHLPFNMSGKQLGSLFGEPPDSSSDEDGASPRRGGATSGLLGTGAMPAGGLDYMAGQPNNLGKLPGSKNLADIDPLLPNSTLSFDNVGGLQSHIQQLKEMVSLPLLYPEVFQRFGITPPRGVLFHGPPGTGKTLMARALAASCSSEGQKISFFMRKGADVLSKWVGEAERQLRLLFEEAKNSQPSIIFFDEIDGLAPVRSSKQDQIHASIVSTLLALMDGMDGRGQVIIIGATNRPDAVDPALRRPGRFDREFYFPLPDLGARRRILEINTSKWQPPLKEEFLDELAVLTKGYGGADLRALCTEAALNAVQRKYPQIYKSSDRLLIKPEEIDVVARDFIISAQNLIPSTARSSSSLASPLPPHLKPLLQHNLDAALESLRKVLPEVKKINVLEEAEYEPRGDGGFAQEKVMQTFESLRVYRPRLLITGQPGLGQNFIGAAVLHHLEGFHVQSLDLATLVGDSVRTPEAGVVQIFNEAKRHKPSILYIPALVNWSETVTDSTKSTVKSLLDSLDPSDPILLLALAEVPFAQVPSDVKSWFGFLRNNRVNIHMPTKAEREAFFAETTASIARKPTEYLDAMPRKKRVLEDLPKAPPLPPRQPTAAELEQQLQHDIRIREHLKFRLNPVLLELKKRYKKFCKPIGDGEEIEVARPKPPGAETDKPTEINDLDGAAAAQPNNEAIEGQAVGAVPEGESTTVTAESAVPDSNGDAQHVATAGEEAAPDAAVTSVPAEPTRVAAVDTYTFRFHDIGLDKIQERMFHDRYHTPDMMLADLQRIVENAYHDNDADTASKADQMINSARVMTDQACDFAFKLECQRMAEREKERQRQAKEQRKKEKSAAEEAAKANVPSGEGDKEVSAPVNGKRARDEDDDAMQQNESSKRPKVDGAGDIEMSDETTEQATQVNGTTHAPSSSTEITQVDPVVANDPQTTSSELETLPNDAAVPELPKQPRSPSPPTGPLPDFILDGSSLDSLSSFLVNNTEELNVEELEQLRAACYDCIWRSRTTWNKNPLIQEIRDLAEDFVSEVEASKQESD